MKEHDKKHKYMQMIGNFFREHRKKHGLGVRDVSKKLDISGSNISRYENAKVDMPLSALLEMSEFYNEPLAKCVKAIDDERVKSACKSMAVQAVEEKMEKRKNKYLAKAQEDVLKNKDVAEEPSSGEIILQEYILKNKHISDMVKRSSIPDKEKETITAEIAYSVQDTLIEISRDDSNLDKRLVAYAKLISGMYKDDGEGEQIKDGAIDGDFEKNVDFMRSSR